MSKVAVVFWSGTGNTEAMAMAVAEGAKEKGAEVSVLTASEFSADQVAALMPLLLVVLLWALSSWRKWNLSPCFPPVKTA